jgi:conjugal transfer pilus assembly protein TraB
MKQSERIASKQKKFFLVILLVVFSVAGSLVFFTQDETPPPSQKKEEAPLEIVSQEVNPQTVRLSTLEQMNETLLDRLESLEQHLTELQENRVEERLRHTQEAKRLTEQLTGIQEELKKEIEQKAVELKKNGPKQSMTTVWEQPAKKEGRNVLYEIPAGTVLKAVLVSGADCSVAVQKPTGPNMVLLRPLDNGQLPRKVRVPLKGSILIGNAIGDLSTERVYIRAERLTLVEKSGDFVETEVTAYISGEDGREGMRGVVVDRSGQIITRAAFAALLQGMGQGVESTFNAQHNSKENSNIPAWQLFGQISQNSAAHGGATALGKLADYYIKRAEQLQPAIQIAAGRVVDIVFTKSVKVGEKDLKRQLTQQRKA